MPRPSTVKPRRAVVAGAGIAGLTAAYRLQQAGWGVEVFEAEPRAGGRVETIVRQGYCVDTGATAFPELRGTVDFTYVRRWPVALPQTSVGVYHRRQIVTGELDARCRGELGDPLPRTMGV